MPVLRTAEGLNADCTTCKRWFNEGVFEGTSHELIHAMRAADWTTQPVVCAECATKLHVWRNEGQPSDISPKRRKAERAAALRTAVKDRAPRRRRSIDTIAEGEMDVIKLAASGVGATTAIPVPTLRRRRTLI